MAKVRHKKQKKLLPEQTKAVFLYGTPNKEKLYALNTLQDQYTDLANDYIAELTASPEYILYIVKNDKKNSELRKLEKKLRPKGMNSAISQTAFDCALAHLSNRINEIRIEILRDTSSILAKSKVLFAYLLIDKTKEDMISVLDDINQSLKKPKRFYEECIETLQNTKDEEFQNIKNEILDLFFMYDKEYRIPRLKHEYVLLDSRVMTFEESANTIFSHVISIVHPYKKGERILIPINTTKTGARRLKQYDSASSVSYTITKSGKLRVQKAFTKKTNFHKITKYEGVDTGMNDCFYTSSGNAFGTMNDITSFYQDTVEPAFAELSKLRNKKRSILHYLHTYPKLSDNERRSLIAKADRLEKMIRKCGKPYRLKRRYYSMLNQEINQSVNAYINSIDKNTMTVLELLDVKSFNASKKLNGKLSVFARGKLQSKLMERLSWEGYRFVEVSPEYTSQICPVCGHLSKDNRNGKTFKCICCGHTDDADHIGSVNIKERYTNNDLKSALDQAIEHQSIEKTVKTYYEKQHKAYLQRQTEAGGQQ